MKTAVISGGNGGLGRALATRLERQGWHSVLMDIDVSGLAASSSRTPVCVDLTDVVALREAAASVIAARPSIDLVIYNAGVSQIGLFEKADAQAHRHVFDINYFAAVEMARLFLQPIRESHGTHLAMSSVAGFAPLHRRTAYAASKHALQGFFTSLRSEEARHGVRCVIAAPSFVATNIGNSKSSHVGTVRPGSSEDGIDHISPDTAAREILRGIERRLDFIPVGRVARLASLLIRISPGLYQRLMWRRIASAEN